MNTPKRACIQDGADFYATTGDDIALVASYPGMVLHDYDLPGAERARIRFLAEHPDCRMQTEDELQA